MPDALSSPGELEALMCLIFAECLDVKLVEPHDDFFDVGGHSLLAAEVVVRVNEEFDVDLKLRDFFRNPTIAHVCRLVRDQAAARASSC